VCPNNSKRRNISDDNWIDDAEKAGDVLLAPNVELQELRPYGTGTILDLAAYLW
jgi:hypothetical protein